MAFGDNGHLLHPRVVLLFIDDDFLLACAREEHAVNLVTIRSLYKCMKTFKRLLQDSLRLVSSAEDDLREMEAAALTVTGADQAGKLNIELFQLRDVTHVLLVRNNPRCRLALQKLSDDLRLAWVFRLYVDLVVVVPERMTLDKWKPDMAEGDFDIYLLKCLFDFFEHICHLDEKLALDSLLDNFFIDIRIQSNKLDVLGHSQINFLCRKRSEIIFRCNRLEVLHVSKAYQRC